MKIQAIKNHQGKVIATYEKTLGQNNMAVEPVLPAGHKVEEMEVAHDFHTNLKASYEKHG